MKPRLKSMLMWAVTMGLLLTTLIVSNGAVQERSRHQSAEFKSDMRIQQQQRKITRLNDKCRQFLRQLMEAKDASPRNDGHGFTPTQIQESLDYLYPEEHDEAQQKK